LDDCRDPKTDNLSDWAERLVKRANSYCEVTPSGRGVRIIGIADGDRVHTVRDMPTGKLEIYRGACGRYITVTGDRVNDAPLHDIDQLIDVYARGANGNSTHVVDLKISTSLDDVDQLRRKYRRKFDDTAMDSTLLEKRSHIIWKIGQQLKTAGATPDEIGTMIAHSAAFRSKHSAASAAQRYRILCQEVARIMSKD
jgi:primase-polymerase (primpol)-like protein